MSRFVTRLMMQAADDKDDGLWQLIQPFVYQSDVAGMIITVPVDFQTDLSSVPRIPIVYWLTGGRASEAAVIHDFAYTTHFVSRRIADHILLEASEVSGVPRWARLLMFYGVRAFGWSHWN